MSRKGIENQNHQNHSIITVIQYLLFRNNFSLSLRIQISFPDIDADTGI